MEQQPSVEKISGISLKAYLEFIASLNMLGGKMIEDEDHAFYVWVTNKVPAYRNIDGVTLLALYEKNVIEEGMTKPAFYRYCLNNGFPSPVPRGEDDQYFHTEFTNFLDVVSEDRRRSYEAWAEENDIDTTAGAITIFTDSEGNTYRVKTDFDNHGEIIAS